MFWVSKETVKTADFAYILFKARLIEKVFFIYQLKKLFNFN